MGYRRILLEIKKRGYIINHKTLSNLHQRNFKAGQPNGKWATDITEFRVKEKKLYLSPIIDLFNGEIINYKTSERPNIKQVIDMLKKYKPNKSDKTLRSHSDQDWQYQMKAYQFMLKRKI